MIVGAGFGGLFAAKALRRADVEVAVIDRTKLGLQGRNWRDRFNYEWSTQLGIYRLSGTVKPTLAYASR